MPRVGLFEKADTVGGNERVVGGMVWIPNNPHMTEVGRPDSREAVLTYLGSLSHGLIDDDLAAAFVDAGPDMVELARSQHPGRLPGDGWIPRLPP